MLATLVLAVPAWSAEQGLEAERISIGLNGVPGHSDAEGWAIANEFQLNFFTTIIQWSEPEPGAYFWPATPEEDTFLQHLRALKKKGYRVALTNTTVHMDQKHLPKYLEGKRFNDPDFLNRWEAFLTAFLTRYGDVVDFLNLGNEVESYFGGHMEEWPDYVEFIRRAREVVRKMGSDVQLGVVFADLDSAALWRDVESYCDYLANNYYTPCSAFLKSPTANALDVNHANYFAKSLNKTLRLAGDKPVLITEVGCATHESIDSSPELQVKFIGQLFEWLQGKEDRILGVSWLSHIDWPYHGTKQALQGYLDEGMLEHEPFIRYLTSLGLMYEDGAKKPGYEAFKTALAHYRGVRALPASQPLASPPKPAFREVLNVLSNGGFEAGNLSETANNAMGTLPWLTANTGDNAIAATGKKVRNGSHSLEWCPIGWNTQDNGTTEDASTFIMTSVGEQVASGATTIRFSGAVNTSALDPAHTVLVILADGTFSRANFETTFRGGQSEWQSFEVTLPLSPGDETFFVAFTVTGTKDVGIAKGALYIDDLVLGFTRQ
jgi:hypothetical protein